MDKTLIIGTAQVLALVLAAQRNAVVDQLKLKMAQLLQLVASLLGAVVRVSAAEV